MRRTMSAAGALLAMTTAALAADLPATGAATPEFEPPPPMPAFTWTGAYAGVHAGYAIGRVSGAVATPGAGPVAYDNHASGVIGGGHVGYNLQTPLAPGGHPLVVGVEGDVDGADDRAETALGGALTGSRVATTASLQGSVRARVGIAAERLLYYATGGAEFADAHTLVDSPLSPMAPEGFGQTRVGYALGGGVEYAFMNDYVLRAEYRHADFGTTDALVTGPVSASTATVSRHDTDDRLQAGISYRFGGSAGR